MGDETPNTMNLDLNLGPVVHPDDDTGSGSLSGESINLVEWLDRPVYRYREALMRQRAARAAQGFRAVPIPPDTRNIALELMGGNGLEMGEGSVATEERPAEVTKTCHTNNGFLEDMTYGKKDNDEKGNGDEGSFFDCNICLDLAREPVVTCCGHLFCWPCLYRWLHLHFDAKECPICKGEVTIKNLTPIYGRGNNTRAKVVDDDSSLKVPVRPQARRVESWRQTIRRNAFSIPVEEIIRSIGNRFDLARNLVHVHPRNPDNPQESPDERSNSLLNRILTSRGLRREQNNTFLPSEDVVNLSQSSPISSEVEESRQLSPHLLGRSNSNRATAISNLTSVLSSAERLVDPYFRTHPVERSLEQPPPVDDRDSLSSIAAIIQSESQTLDTTIEIDSNVSLSTSSSRRRYDASRISDVDSGDSRAPRRRRFT